MMETTYTLRLGQLLKITPDLKKYMWQKLKLEKPNITSKVISKPSVATVVETRSEINNVAIEVNNQMVVTQVQVGKNIIEDVLIVGGASVNIIIEKLITKLGLPKLIPTPYHLRIADQSMTRPMRIIKIYYLKNNVVDFNYSMLLGRPWLRDVKITHD
jgi:hypothetical protein